MTNAPDFNLDAALDATDDWDDFESGYADEPAADLISADGPDPEEELTTGEQDLAERHALRRVDGLRTELEDITEVEYRQLRLEKVILVGVWTSGTVADAENSMAELALLAETAGSEVLDAIYQRRQTPDPATFIGRGKVEGLLEIVQASGADTVILDGDLAPSQLRNLEDKLKVKAIDRTGLILDIFAQHAKSKEGQAQVELAQLNYMKQRLRGWGGNLSRQAGGRVSGGEGIGGRGPGETKIETDRRRINTKIAKLRKELKELKGTRATMRQERSAQPHPERLDRRLHQRRQVLDPQPAHRRRGAGRRLAVRDARPDHAAYDDQGRSRLHDVRHRRLRAAPAPPARRGLPLHARRGRRLRPDPARRRRLAPRPRGPAGRGARGVRRDPRLEGPRARRSSTRPTRPTRW